MAVLTAQRGLVTLSSELSRPDGAMVVADNVVIDADNTIQQRRGFKEYSEELPEKTKQIISYKNKLIAHYENTLSIDDGSGSFVNFAGSYSELVQGLRIKYIEANGNCYFTTSSGIKKISAKDATSLQSSVITDAGGVKAIDLSGKLIPDEAGFLPPQSKVSYKLVFGTKDANNNLVLGSPSSRTLLTNGSQEIKQSEIFTVNILTYSGIIDQQYFTFSVKDKGYAVWYNKTGSAVEPVDANTIDKELIEVNIQGASSNSDVAARTATAILGVAGNVVSVEVSLGELEFTVISPGDVTDVSQGSHSEVNLKVTKIFDGSITAGIPAKAELSFSIPSRVTTDYFYQIYRTATATVSEGVTINDIDPGDEHNFVFEAPVTAADILAGEIVIEDNTPENFRASGAYLYTNSINGQGILQANERPPIAHDIASFRNSTFYANTKDVHRITFSVLSVDDFVSGNTKFYIHRGSDTSEYVFVGRKEVTTVQVKKKTETIGGTYFTLNAANDERSYYFWMDKGTITHTFNSTTAHSGNAITVSNHGFCTNDAISFTGSVPNGITAGTTYYAIRVDANTFKVASTVNGSELTLSDAVGTATVIHASVDPAVSGKLGVRVPIGLYEDTLQGSADAIMDSIIGVGDFDTLDLGSGLVEITCTDAGDVAAPTHSALASGWVTNVTTEGDGEDAIAREVLLSSISSTAISIDLTARSLVKVINKDEDCPVVAMYLSGVDDLPGKILLEAKSLEDVNFYIGISSSSLVQEFNPEVPHYVGSGAFPTTNASDNTKSPNRIYFSKTLQPESVPMPNYIDVGSKDKEILRILALRDNLFVLKEDGIYTVTGQSAPNFSVKLLDNSATLIAPDSAVVLNNLIYALTTQGIVTISETGVSIVSRSIEDQIQKVTTFAYQYKYASFGVAYESDRAYLLWLPTIKSDTVATQCFRFNSITNTWTRWTKSNTCGLVKIQDDRLYLGSAERNVIEQERKNGERQDYADRDFTLSLNNNSISGSNITLSSTVDVEVGDVIVQEQYLTISKFNRFVKTLNKDAGLQTKDYDTLVVSKGDNLGNSLILLVDKLNNDPSLSGIVFTCTGLNTLDALKTDFNTIIAKLNEEDTATANKSYRQVKDLITYETIITNIDSRYNLTSVKFVPNFIQGDIQIYKGIKSEVQWAPQHFGKPEKLKQVSSGTLIFDQGNIYGGTVAYSSDRSADFVEIPFDLNSPGFWVSYPWANAVWGGGGKDAPLRTLIPGNKSRCRYLNVKFKHQNAREGYKLIGVSLEPREISDRGYR